MIYLLKDHTCTSNANHPNLLLVDGERLVRKIEGIYNHFHTEVTDKRIVTNTDTDFCVYCGIHNGYYKEDGSYVDLRVNGYDCQLCGAN